jgi:O-antigen/teichoic acid export membrane protein
LTAESLTHGKHRSGLLKNIFSLGLVQIANYVFPFITVPYVVRIIGPDKFGVINFATAFVAYFTLLINYGFDLSATRAIAANRDNLEERNRIFNEVIFAKCLLMALSAVAFAVSLYFIPQLREERAVAIFTFLICFSWVITPNWLYQGMQDLYRMAVFNLIIKVLFTAVILFVVQERSDYIWQPLAVSGAQIVVGLFSFFFAIRKYNITLQQAKLQRVLQLLWNERIIFFSMIVVNLYTTTNIVLLGLMQQPAQVGYYTAAWRLITIIQALISLPLSQALFPFIGTAFSQGREKGLEIVRQLLPVVSLVTLSATVVLWLIGPFVIMILFGEQFEASVAVFRILAFLPVIIGWSNLLGIQTMINLKMDKTFFRITSIGAITSILLNIVLVRRFGYIGSAWCWLLTEIFITVTMFVVLQKNGVRVFERSYFSPDHFKKYLKPILLIIQQKIHK